MLKKFASQKFIYFIITTFLLLTMILVACEQQTSSTPSPTVSAPKTNEPVLGGTLRLSQTSDGISIGFPAKLSRVISNRQAAPAVETLFRMDKSAKLVPWLATGYTSDVATKVITISLRKSVKFHDSTDFNAEAVKWNLDQCKTAKVSGTEKFKSADVVDDYTVRINLTEWDSTVISNLTQTLGMMVSPTAYKQNGEAWSMTHPVGTGAFQIVEWQKDVKTTYKKFPGYWQKGKPYLDAVEVIPITAPLTQELTFRGGELDLIFTSTALGLSKLESDGFIISRRRTGTGATAMIPDSANANSPFKDLKVRQAAQYAIDSAAIVKAVFFNENEVTNQWIYKSHWAYNPTVVGYPYNPTKAKQLLAEAGFQNGFKTKITCTPANQEAYAPILGYFKEVGITAELNIIQSALQNQIIYGGTWEGLFSGPLSPNPDIVVPLNQWFSGNSAYTQMLKPDDMVKAIQNAVTAADFETKQKNAQEVMKLMFDKYCLMNVIQCTSEFAISGKYVHNHGFDQTASGIQWNPEETWLDKK